MIVQGTRGRSNLSVPETWMDRPVRRRTDPDEVRARILDVAEERFRRVGYHKTSVADIASELGMSPANVYRFFSSRDAINEAICRRVVKEVADIAFASRARTRPPWKSSTGF
jgi:AcrR family transcriptional regulator